MLRAAATNPQLYSQFRSAAECFQPIASNSPAASNSTSAAASGFQLPSDFEVPEGSTLVAVQFEGDEDITYIPQPGDEDLVVSPVTKCFLFPPVGGQKVNMGKGLYENNEDFRAAMLECNQISKPLLPMELLRVLYPARRDLPMCEEAINTAQYAQPCLFAVEYALYKLCAAKGLQPDMVIGHSVGEFMCAVAAGLMDVSSAMQLVCARATLMHNTPSSGSMMGVPTSEQACSQAIAAATAIDASIANKVSIASVNHAQSTVLAGDWSSLSDVLEQLPEELNSVRVQASHADHSPLMSVISAPLKMKAAELIDEIDQKRNDVVVISTVTGAVLEGQMDADYWALHNESTVRFSDAIQACAARHRQINNQPKSVQHRDPVLYFVEMGEGMLSRFTKKVSAQANESDEIYATKDGKVNMRLGACLVTDADAQEAHFTQVVDECKQLVEQAEINAFLIDPLGAAVPAMFAHLEIAALQEVTATA